MRYLPGFAFIKDSHGRRVYLNSNYERVLGWNIPECIGKTDAELHNPELARQFALTDAQVLSESRAVRYITRTHEKGEDRALLTVKFPIPASDRGSALIGGLCLDITEQEAAERERREIEHQMQQAQKLESLGLLAGGIAHDFNNLLMGMLGHADLALTKVGGDDGARHHIEEVIASAQRAAELANQLLAYSGEGKFLLEVVNISRVVEDLGGLLKVSITKKAMLRVNLDPAVLPVECDATQIRQVLMNIIVNASDSLENKPGTITVETGSAHLPADDFSGAATFGAALKTGDYVYVKITDTGIGMNEGTLSRIFDPFFSTKFAGHGLGLAAALGIVRSHHGTIRIKSTPGKGSVFTVYLPASTLPLTQVTPEKHGKLLWKGSGTLLLADDEDTVRDVATMMLEEIGFEVISVTNGREAVDAARENGHRLRAILLDLTMPTIGGVEAYHAIRSFNSTIPIVLSSGYNKEDDVAEASGVTKPLFLKKPYRLDAMRSVFKRALAESVVTAGT
jgi:two-component system cell cycle sensor histidine kinase/response regulator CckA